MTTTINADNVTGGAVVTGDSSGELGLQTAGTTRMTITSAGNVGIGTSSPGALLHVSADAAKIRVGVTTSSQYTDIYRDNATGYTIYNAAQASPYRAHVWQLGGTEAARINYDGNVGIGTSTPGYKLDVTGSSVVARINSSNNNNVLAISYNGTIGGYLGANSTNLIFGDSAGTERMRITSDGDVLVGCTSAPSASVVGVRLGKSATQGYGMSSTSSTGSVEHWYYYNPNGLVGTITTSGSATAYNTSSDRRLKDNIAPAGKAQDILNSIEIVQHDWKAGGHTRFGVVAQDLNEVYPEAVAAGDNGDVVKKTWGVDYSKLVPLLVKSIQEQQQQIDALKAEVAALKGE